MRKTRIACASAILAGVTGCIDTTGPTSPMYHCTPIDSVLVLVDGVVVDTFFVYAEACTTTYKLP